MAGSVYKASRPCRRGVGKARRARQCTEGPQGAEFLHAKAKRLGKQNSNLAYYITLTYITINLSSLNIYTSLLGNCHAIAVDTC
jgi:hypothetical protein